jgi:hypothetical protein
MHARKIIVIISPPLLIAVMYPIFHAFAGIFHEECNRLDDRRRFSGILFEFSGQMDEYNMVEYCRAHAERHHHGLLITNRYGGAGAGIVRMMQH